MFRALLWTVGASVGLIGCAPNSSTYGLSVNQLISMQDRRVGQKVTVEGYLRFSSSSRNLWHSKASSETEPYEDCVSVGWTSMNVDRLMRYNEKKVRITGELVHDTFGEDEINLWYCSDWYIATERVTLVGDH